MSTAADLLAAIRDNPDDDTPRLVYADWCDDTRQPERAEFIRAQCARARLPDWDAQAREFRRRERVLLARHGRSWLAELPSISGLRWGGFERGFVSEVCANSAADFVAQAEAARAVAPVRGVAFTSNELNPGAGTVSLPWLRTIRLADRTAFVPARFAALLQSPLSEHVRVLNLSGVGVENPGALAVASAQHLKHLEELDLSEGYVGVAGAQALADAPHLSNLRVLRFDSHGSGYVDDPFLRTEGVRALAESPYLKSLTTLGLAGHGTDQEAVALLLHHPGFARLERVSLGSIEFTSRPGDLHPRPARWQELDLTYCEFDATTLSTLLALPQLSELRRLRLTNTELTAEGVRAVASSPTARQLRELYAADNSFGVDGATAIAEGSWPHLHTIDLGGNDLGAAGAGVLAQATGLAALADVRLADNDIEDAGATAVAGAAWAGGVRHLALGTNGITAPGAAALAASPALRQLARLNLDGNSLGAAGGAALAAAGWPNLTDLNVSGSECGDEAVAALAQSALAGRLITLDLDGCDLTPAALSALATGATDLGDLTVSNNPRLGTAGADLLSTGNPFPRLRSLHISNSSIPSAAVTRLLRSPLGIRLLSISCWGNEMTQEGYAELRSRSHGSLGPDWVGDGSEPSEPIGPFS